LIGIKPTQKVRDLWLHKDMGPVQDLATFSIPPHGVVVLKTY